MSAEAYEVLYYTLMTLGRFVFGLAFWLLFEAFYAQWKKRRVWKREHEQAGVET